MFLRKFLQKLLNVPIEVPIASSEEAYYLFREGKRRGRERKYAFEMWLKLSHSFQSLYQFYDHPSFNFYPEEAPLIIKRMIELCSSVEEAEKVNDKIEVFGKSKEKAKVKICTKLKDDLFFKAYSLAKDMDHAIFLVDISSATTKELAKTVRRECFDKAINEADSVENLIRVYNDTYPFFNNEDDLYDKLIKKIIDSATFDDIMKAMDTVIYYKNYDAYREAMRIKWEDVCHSALESVISINVLEKIINNDRWCGVVTGWSLQKVKEIVNKARSIKEIKCLYDQSSVDLVQNIIMKAWINVFHDKLSEAKNIDDLFPILLYIPINSGKDLVSKFNKKLSEIAYESTASALSQEDLHEFEVIYEYSPIGSEAEKLVIQAIKGIELIKLKEGEENGNN